MKCTLPEISWHNREPVLSIHIQPISDKFYRLATGGADCHVLIWQLIIIENGAVKIEALSDLTRHQRAVNSVRWSPNGQYLATADDDANIIIWQLKTDNIPLLEGESNNKETWIVYKVMRGHKEDIYDLCWSSNGLKLLSGSIDNTAILWDFTKGTIEQILTDHKGFVQGVSWDPKGQYLATISTDRICRIYDSSGKQIKNRIQRGLIPVSSNHFLHNKEVKYFHDDTFKSFFRRLDFSPDGTLLAVPSGKFEIDDSKKIMNATLIFAVDQWTGPISVLPSGKQYSTVVRFCPILFEIQENGPDPVMALPFRMVLAVGTDHDVILYDTQQVEPFAYFKDIHYTRLTDLTWSHDAQLLVASSTDGYCALITFEPNELGIPYTKEESEVEESILEISGCEELEKEDINDISKPKKLNLLEQWTVKTPKKEFSQSNTPVDDYNKRKREDETKTITPKRIKPIPVKEETKVEHSLCKKIEAENEEKKVRKLKPITISNEPKTNQTEVLAKPKPKVSPLLSFLKRAEKSSFKTPTTQAHKSEIIDLTLDELEARDAWKCEKEETKNSDLYVINMDECTEDISLHLDDTNSKSTSKVNSDAIKENIDKVEICEELKTELPTNVLVEKVKNDDCVQNDLKHKSGQVGSKISSDSAKTEKLGGPDLKGTPKRRVPLITLSSPKHKKK